MARKPFMTSTMGTPGGGVKGREKAAFRDHTLPPPPDG
jgi:hypothetical protein